MLRHQTNIQTKTSYYLKLCYFFPSCEQNTEKDCYVIIETVNVLMSKIYIQWLFNSINLSLFTTEAEGYLGGPCHVKKPILTII